MSRHYASMRLNHGEVVQTSSVIKSSSFESKVQDLVFAANVNEGNLTILPVDPDIPPLEKASPIDDSTRKKQGLQPLTRINLPSIPAQQHTAYQLAKYIKLPRKNTIAMVILGGISLLFLVLIISLIIVAPDNLAAWIIIALFAFLILILLVIIAILMANRKGERFFGSRHSENREEKEYRKASRPLYSLALSSGIWGIALIIAIGFFSTIFSVRAILYGRQTIASREYQRDQTPHKKARAAIILGKINIIAGFVTGIALLIVYIIAVSGLGGIAILLSPLIIIPAVALLTLYSFLMIKYVFV